MRIGAVSVVRDREALDEGVCICGGNEKLTACSCITYS
jgi:hypothetical protein